MEQIIEFELKGARTPWQYMYSYSWLFSRQNKDLEGISLNGLLFTSELLQKAMHLTSPYTWAKSQNLTPKCKIIDVFWI